MAATLAATKPAPSRAAHEFTVEDIEYLNHGGAPLLLRIGALEQFSLGPDLTMGQRPQCLVPRDAWQSALSLGGWTLCSCVVTPAFAFSGFELAPPDWQPDQ